MTSPNSTPSPSEAQYLLAKAEKLSKQTHESIRWPYTAFILTLGIVTSGGTLAMALTEGESFGLSYVGTLSAFFALLMFFFIATKGKLAFAWSKRWTIYIAAWALAYMGGIAVVAFAHGSVPLAVIASALILAVTVTATIIEVKR